MRLEIPIVLVLSVLGAYLFLGRYFFRRNYIRIAQYAGFDSASLLMGTEPSMASLRLGLERELTRLARVQKNLSWGVGLPDKKRVGESYVQHLLEDFVDKRFSCVDYTEEEIKIREIANFADDIASQYEKSNLENAGAISNRLRNFARELDLWREAVHWFVNQAWGEPFPVIYRERHHGPSRL